MSLVGALNAAETALATQQAALQVTGNNIANAGNENYTRQTVLMSPATGQQVQPGIFLGTGVNLTGVQRNVDDALLGRLRASVSDNEAANTIQSWFGRVESVFNALGDENLSTRMSTFFKGWSDLANKPQDAGQRQIVLQEGQSLATRFQDLRGQLQQLQIDSNGQSRVLAGNANALAQQVADLNEQIVTSEGSAAGSANSLRDQRDAVLGQLSQLMDIQTTNDGAMVNVYVGSEPLVAGTANRGIVYKAQNPGESGAPFRVNGTDVRVKGGQIGGLSEVRDQIISAVDQVDTLAHNMIYELNKLHSSGQGTEGFSSVTASNAVDDPSAALNDAKSGVDFPVQNGSFVIHLKNTRTGLSTSTLVQVDMQSATKTTLNSLMGSLNSVGNITASISAGQLKIQSNNNDVQISFSQDTSGTLAALGINTFFTGTDARNIAVNTVVSGRPALLAAAMNGESGDNQTALAIGALASQPLNSARGVSLDGQYQSMVNGIGVSSAAAKSNATATQVVVDTLKSQRESLSGVSLDEEAVNLMRQQRAFQGAAKLIAAVDEMMKTMMAMI